VTATELAGMLDLARDRVSLVTIAACWSAALTAAEQRRLLGLPVTDLRAAGRPATPDADDRGGAEDGRGGGGERAPRGLTIPRWVKAPRRKRW
jgi:hypothetical protein